MPYNITYVYTIVFLKNGNILQEVSGLNNAVSGVVQWTMFKVLIFVSNSKNSLLC